MKLQIILAFLVFFTNGVFAETAVVGNGGNILVCSDTDEYNFTVVDLYELENSYHLVLNESLNLKLSDKEIVSYLLKRLFALGFKEAEELETYWKKFQNEAKHVNFNFFLSGDLSTYAKPSNCDLKTIVFQRDNNPYYIIHKDWIYLNSLNRAALIMHELIYRLKLENVYYNNLSSDAVRKLNAYMFSIDFVEKRNLKYIKKLFSELLEND